MKRGIATSEFWGMVGGIISIVGMVLVGVPISPDVLAGTIGLMVSGYGVSRGIAKRGPVSQDLADKIDKALRRR